MEPLCCWWNLVNIWMFAGLIPPNLKRMLAKNHKLVQTINTKSTINPILCLVLNRISYPRRPFPLIISPESQQFKLNSRILVKSQFPMLKSSILPVFIPIFHCWLPVSAGWIHIWWVHPRGSPKHGRVQSGFQLHAGTARGTEEVSTRKKLGCFVVYLKYGGNLWRFNDGFHDD